MHRFPQHQKIIKKYSIEIYTPPPPHDHETIISNEIPELILALKERERDYFAIKNHLVPRIKEVKEELCPPMIAEWSGEGYFLNIYPTFVTSGFWYADEEPDEDDPNYRGKDSFPMDDFLLICEFYLDFLKEKYKWAFDIWNQIEQSFPEIYKKEIDEKRLMINHYFHDLSWSFYIKHTTSDLRYDLNFSRIFQFINVSFDWDEIRKTHQSQYFKINNIDLSFVIPTINKMIFDVIENQKINFPDATIKRVFTVKGDLDFEDKKSYETFLNKLKAGQSDYSPTEGYFKLQVLKNFFGTKKFQEITQCFKWEIKKEIQFVTLDGRDIFFSLILDDFGLKEYSLYILSRGRISYSYHRISFLGKWKVSL